MMAVNTNVNAIARARNFVSTCPAADDEDTVPVAEPVQVYTGDKCVTA